MLLELSLHYNGEETLASFVIFHPRVFLFFKISDHAAAMFADNKRAISSPLIMKFLWFHLNLVFSRTCTWNKKNDAFSENWLHLFSLISEKIRCFWFQSTPRQKKFSYTFTAPWKRISDELALSSLGTSSSYARLRCCRRHFCRACCRCCRFSDSCGRRS